ncbi:hypothetical protein EYF80_057526 [Liparis tanakae]|uniref:Uncharacterized protein n=1 Tax=Liparis tanakae TaxID=230148 RepID=A0A4Z2EVC9_9TELE|nr:hypothetical protein EYF80_057526 [Liparis tanakae]
MEGERRCENVRVSPSTYMSRDHCGIREDFMFNSPLETTCLTDIRPPRDVSRRRRACDSFCLFEAIFENVKLTVKVRQAAERKGPWELGDT